MKFMMRHGEDWDNIILGFTGKKIKKERAGHKLMGLVIIVAVLVGTIYLALHPSWETISDDDVAERVLYVRVDERLQKNLTELMLAGITETALEAHIATLQDFGTRYACSVNITSAATYIFNQFTEIKLTVNENLSVEYQQFEHEGDVLRNIIATLPGTNTTSNATYILGAHYDSINDPESWYEPNSPAPGADDDATGVAALLTIAKVMANYTYDTTIEFVAFTAEEIIAPGSGGFIGSKYYVEHRDSNESIRGMIQMDSIGYKPYENKSRVDVVANQRSEWLGRMMNETAAKYNLSLIVNNITKDDYNKSDHCIFWAANISACLVIEEHLISSPNFNPYMHTANDTVDKLNLTYCANITQMCVATLVELSSMTLPSTTMLELIASYNEIDVAYNGTGRVTVTRLPKSLGEPPEGLMEMGTCFHVGVSGNVSDLNVTVHYSASAVPDDVDEESFRLYYWDDDQRQWILVPIGGVDTANGVLWAMPKNLTIFAVMAQKPAEEPKDIGDIGPLYVAINVMVISVNLVMMVIVVRHRK